MQRFIKESLKNPVDVAVATPDSLLKFRREEQILLSDLRHIVIDEADTLFDPSFEDATTSILKSLQIRSKKVSQTAPVTKGTQVTIVGATLSTKMLSKIEKLVPVSSIFITIVTESKPLYDSVIMYIYKLDGYVCRISRRFRRNICIRYCRTLNSGSSKQDRMQKQVNLCM